jgi:hypothetical protein
MLAALVFLTPSGGLVALAVGLPLAAFAAAAARRARVRVLLRLAPPSRGETAVVVALSAILCLLALAAAGPALRGDVGRRVRASTEAFFVVDVSRSMAASAGSHAPTRFAQAQAAALRLRGSIPDVRAGVASLTNQMLPHLFPTADESAFAATVEQGIGIGRPPPQGSAIVQTSYLPLAALSNQGYFRRATKHRVAVLLTDGESGPFFAASIGQALRPTTPPPPNQIALLEEPISLLIVRFGGTGDRIYDAHGTIEAAYRPDVRARTIVEGLATAAGGHAFDSGHLADAQATLRKQLGSAETSAQGTRTKTTTLAPFVALAALAPLGLILRRRNFERL